MVYSVLPPETCQTGTGYRSVGSDKWLLGYDVDLHLTVRQSAQLRSLMFFRRQKNLAEREGDSSVL